MAVLETYALTVIPRNSHEPTNDAHRSLILEENRLIGTTRASQCLMQTSNRVMRTYLTIYATLHVCRLHVALPLPHPLINVPSTNRPPWYQIKIFDLCVQYCALELKFLPYRFSFSNCDFRFNILEIAGSLGGAILQMSTGYWITSSGFLPSAILIAGCGLVALIFVPFMKSTDYSNSENSETSPLLANQVDDVKYSVDEAKELDHSRLYSLRKQLLTSWNIYTTKRCVCDECIQGGVLKHFISIFFWVYVQLT